MSKVFFLPIEKKGKNGNGISVLVKRVFDPETVKASDITALKIHPGEEGNTSYVPAEDVNRIAEAMELPRDSVFLTDTTVLYPGRRMTAPQYLRLSREHGFGLPDTPPFLVADGLHGEDEYILKTPDDFETGDIHLARLIANSDSMVVVSHFKGHLLTGFGGALKNLGMGCASRAGKLYQHSSVKPVIKADKCTACGVCTSYCPQGAISVNEIAAIDKDLCTGCGECLGRCPEVAIRVSWNQDMDVFMRRMIEYAWGPVQVSRPLFYVNFVTAVVPDCDCMQDTEPSFVDDIGVLASRDPVALDRASLDLVTKAPDGANSPVKAGSGKDKFRAYRRDIQGELQLSLAEKIGLGTQEYELVRVRY